MKKRTFRIVFAAAAAAAVLLTVFLVVRENSRKETIYRQAVRAMEAGDAAGAYRIFQSLKGYRDAEQQSAALSAQDTRLPWLTAEKGDTVLFGRWEQDNDAANGPEPIEWIVLDRIDSGLVLLSAVCLNGLPYNSTPFEPVTWETCSLRKWLNETFLTAAFSEEEQALIPEVLNKNEDHSLAETEGGRETADRVFLLSELETVIYLRSESDRDFIGKASASARAQADGLQVGDNGTASWWLRSPGMYEWVAQFVDRDGVPYINGANVDMENYCGVRPVIWLDAKGDLP